MSNNNYRKLRLNDIPLRMGETVHLLDPGRFGTGFRIGRFVSKPMLLQLGISVWTTMYKKGV